MAIRALDSGVTVWRISMDWSIAPQKALTMELGSKGLRGNRLRIRSAMDCAIWLGHSDKHSPNPCSWAFCDSEANGRHSEKSRDAHAEDCQRRPVHFCNHPNAVARVRSYNFGPRGCEPGTLIPQLPSGSSSWPLQVTLLCW